MLCILQMLIIGTYLAELSVAQTFFVHVPKAMKSHFLYDRIKVFLPI